MREIFSVRFFAAVGAVTGLFLLLTTVFATREVIEGDGDAEPAVVEHRIDLVDEVVRSNNPGFRLDEDGLAVGDVVLTLDETRAVRIVAGTPGVDHCGALGSPGACAIVADLLGEAVVWFALVPMGAARSVPMPAIDVLDDGKAHLVNGWVVDYAPVLDRRCDDEFVSYREFRDVLGDDFTALFDIDDRRLAAVVCRQRVGYAPEPAEVTATSAPPTSLPDGPLRP